MTILYFLLPAAAYGLFCTCYDIYRMWFDVTSDQPDFLPPQEGTGVRKPKTPLPSSGAAEARVEVDSIPVSQVP
jgi:hypothetical protein